MVEYTLSQREPNCQTLGGHARPYSYRENLDLHPHWAPHSASPRAARDEEAVVWL